jgi:hypothetical protein
MCLVLDSHFSIKEDVRLAETIRQHALANDNADIELKGYQIVDSASLNHPLSEKTSLKRILWRQ